MVIPLVMLLLVAFGDWRGYLANDRVIAIKVA